MQARVICELVHSAIFDCLLPELWVLLQVGPVLLFQGLALGFLEPHRSGTSGNQCAPKDQPKIAVRKKRDLFAKR